MQASEQAQFTCTDSVMSHHEPASPHAAGMRPSVSHAASAPTSSPPDSHMSFGSSPAAADAVMADAPLLRGPSLPAGLPRKPGPLERRSLHLLQSLGRTDSANQTHELEAMHQVRLPSL